MENENSTSLLNSAIMDRFFSIEETKNNKFHVTGIYCFYYNGIPIYVGQSVDIYNRMRLHLTDYKKYCGYALDPNITIETIATFRKEFEDDAPLTVEEDIDKDSTEEVEAKKVRVGSRKLYEFICQIPNGKYASEDNISNNAIKIKVLHLCERSKLNKLEEDEIDINYTFVIHRNDGRNKFACNLTKGGDNPPHPTKISFEEANFIRKLAAEKDVYHMSVKEEKAFIAKMCDLFKIKNVQTDNPDDNYIRRILRNRFTRYIGSPTYAVTTQQLKTMGFTKSEIKYFKDCNNAWTDNSKWFSEYWLNSRQTIITYAEVYADVRRTSRGCYPVGSPIKTFGKKDSNESCESEILGWLAENGKTKLKPCIELLRGYFKRTTPDTADKVFKASTYYWRGIAIPNPDYKKKPEQLAASFNADKLSYIDEAFGSAYSNNLDISKALENKDYCIDLIKDFYGYDGPIETGGFYILPDGTAVKSANHLDIDNLLVRYHYIKRLDREPMQYGDGSQFMDAINCVRIRRRGGRDSWILPYMIIPEKPLTSAQYTVIENWAKFVLEKSHELNVQTLDNKSKVFKSSQHTYFDVIDAIKLYYRAHILEDLREDYEIIFDDNDSESVDYFDQFDSDSLLEFIDEPTFTSIKPGDIIFSKLVQRNYDYTKGHDTRPLLVINKTETEVYGFYITSTNNNLKMDFYRVELDDWSNEGLKRPSYVNLAEEKHTKAKFISGPNPIVGHISKHDLDKIIEHLDDIYCVRQYPFKYNIGLTLNNLRKIS